MDELMPPLMDDAPTTEAETHLNEAVESSVPIVDEVQEIIREGGGFDPRPPQQATMVMAQPFSNQNQQIGPPSAPFIFHGHGWPNPSASNHCYINETGVGSPFPLMYNTPAINRIMPVESPTERPYQFQYPPLISPVMDDTPTFRSESDLNQAVESRFETPRFIPDTDFYPPLGISDPNVDPIKTFIREGGEFDPRTPRQGRMVMVQPFLNQNQQIGPPSAPFIYHGGCPNPSATYRCCIHGTAVEPPFPSMYNTPPINSFMPVESPYQFQHQQLVYPCGYPRPLAANQSFIHGTGVGSPFPTMYNTPAVNSIMPVSPYQFQHQQFVYHGGSPWPLAANRSYINGTGFGPPFPIMHYTPAITTIRPVESSINETGVGSPFPTMTRISPVESPANPSTTNQSSINETGVGPPFPTITRIRPVESPANPSTTNQSSINETSVGPPFPIMYNTPAINSIMPVSLDQFQHQQFVYHDGSPWPLAANQSYIHGTGVGPPFPIMYNTPAITTIRPVESSINETGVGSPFPTMTRIRPVESPANPSTANQSSINETGVGPHFPTITRIRPVDSPANPSTANQSSINETGVGPPFPTINIIRPVQSPSSPLTANQSSINETGVGPHFPTITRIKPVESSAGRPYQYQEQLHQWPQMPMSSTFTNIAYPQWFVDTSDPSTSRRPQGFHSGWQQFGQIQNMQPATQQFNPANSHPPQQFNSGSSSNQGRGSDCQGGSSSNQGRGFDSQGGSSSNQGRVSDSQGGSFSNQGRGSDNQGGLSSNQGKGSDSQGGSSSNQGRGSDSQGSSSSNQGRGSDSQGGSSSNQGRGSDSQGGSSSNQGRGSDSQGGSHLRGRRGGRQTR